MVDVITGVWLNLNYACNLNCTWCYNKSLLNSNVSMNKELAKKIIHIMQECGAQKYCLIGGEPTLNNDLIDIIQLIHSYGSNSVLLTNGILLVDSDYCFSLKQAGLGGVNISIKAITNDSMKLITGYNDVGYLKKVAQNLKKADINYTASIVVSKYTCDDLTKICSYMKKIGFDDIIISFCQPVLCNQEKFIIENESLDDTIYVIKSFFHQYDSINKLMDGRISGCGPLPLCVYPKDVLQKMVLRKQLDNGCIILSRHGVVFNPMGEVTICNHLQDFCIGKMGVDFDDKDSFMNYWNSSDVQSVFDEMSTLPHEDCLKCNMLKFCGGSCSLRWFQYSIDELKERMIKEGII